MFGIPPLGGDKVLRKPGVGSKFVAKPVVGAFGPVARIHFPF